MRCRELWRGRGAVLRVILHVVERLRAISREGDPGLKSGRQVLSFKSVTRLSVPD